MTLTAQQTKLFAAGGVLALAVAYLVATSLSTTTVYYLTVAELLESRASSDSQLVRVAGIVTPGSIVREDGGLSVRFIMQDESGSLPVVYRGGTIPDIFGDSVEVVVEGRMAADGSFTAHTLLAKCPSRFEDGAPASTGAPGTTSG